MSDHPQESHLPTREQIPPHMRWRLEDIYPDEAAWERDLSAIRGLMEQLKGFQGTLGQSGARLLSALTAWEKLGESLDRLLSYAHMRLDEDTGNTGSQARWQRAQRLAVEAEEVVAFLEPEILSLSESTLQEFLNQEPGLGKYRHYLEDLWRRKPHTLDVEQEALLARMGELVQAPHDIFGLLTDADLEFPVIEGEDGRPVRLSEGRYLRLMESRDRRVRQAAFEALYGTYRRVRNTLAGLLATSVRKDVFLARSRRYPSALAAALHADNVPEEVYTNLIQTVRSRLGSLHRYLRIRRRMLGLSDLHMYDLYVPLVDEVPLRVSFEEAAQTVMDSLQPLGEEYVAVVRRAIESRWIDVLENKGKRPGAYCAGVYGVHPYILMNFQGSLNDMFTLTHEMGHALHDYYAHGTQPFVYATPSIFTAEVASTLNEALLYRHLMQVHQDARVRIYLLVEQLEQVRRTIYRQVKFAEFELAIHRIAEAGEPLTADSLCALYKRLNEDYYGAEVVVDDPIELEWARIPHFYSPFYVYKYATGLSAASALATRILQEGTPAVERYINFLRAGSSDYPLELLRRAGVDLTTPQPILAALDAFERHLDELEELAGI